MNTDETRIKTGKEISRRGTRMKTFPVGQNAVAFRKHAKPECCSCHDVVLPRFQHPDREPRGSAADARLKIAGIRHAASWIYRAGGHRTVRRHRLVLSGALS